MISHEFAIYATSSIFAAFIFFLNRKASDNQPYIHLMAVTMLMAMGAIISLASFIISFYVPPILFDIIILLCGFCLFTASEWLSYLFNSMEELDVL
jgi:O-antigen/teichoic acid export membrane protein